MESKLMTIKQAAKILKDRVGPNVAWDSALRLAAKDLADALGVDLAPDEPELAEWFGEPVDLSEDGGLVRGGVASQVVLSSLGIIPPHLSKGSQHNCLTARRTLVEGYNRWCRIAKHLEERAGILSHIRRLAEGETPDAP